MSFGAIRDHDAALRLLRNMLQRNRIPNGLMFWGPGGVGKRLVALEMAKAINCTRRDGDACDTCLSCRKINNANHPDVTAIAPVKKSRIIDVETVRSITDLAALRPFESQWRVFVIQEADRMGVPAQNHFLKTLEEPPGRSLFILITEYPGMLLSTIRSRCQRVRFGALRPETVCDLLLQSRDLPRNVAESVAAVAQGQMSRAFDLVDSDRRDVVLDIARRLAEGEDPVALAEDFTKRLDLQRGQLETALKAELDTRAPNELSREDKEEQKTQYMALVESMVRRDIMEYLYLFQTWYRDALVYGATQDASRVFNRDHLDRLEAAGTSSAADADRRFAAINKARVYLERNLNVDRVFRDMFFVLAE